MWDCRFQTCVNFLRHLSCVCQEDHHVLTLNSQHADHIFPAARIMSLSQPFVIHTIWSPGLWQVNSRAAFHAPLQLSWWRIRFLVTNLATDTYLMRTVIMTLEKTFSASTFRECKRKLIYFKLMRSIKWSDTNCNVGRCLIILHLFSTIAVSTLIFNEHQQHALILLLIKEKLTFFREYYNASN